MGTSFRYASVFAGKSFPSEVRSRVIDLMRARARSGPYLEVATRAEADRSIAVARLSAAPWLHVADERDLHVYDHSLFERARVLSVETARPVVSTSVFDSDDISMIQWKEGEPMDVFARARQAGLPMGLKESATKGDPTKMDRSSAGRSDSP